jgi:hypothetical protein
MAKTRRKLGQVIITQVQPSGLIYEVPAGEIYDPSRRVEVPRLSISSHGVEGETAQGERLLDIHHADHPETHNNGNNAISIGFTSHYEMMRTRFGEHMQVGTAGENIIIEYDHEVWLPDLGQKVQFKNPESGQVVSLDVIKFATPCDPFSHFAADSQDERLPAEEIKIVLQLLGNGRRGFLLSLGASQTSGQIQSGDLVCALD